MDYKNHENNMTDSKEMRSGTVRGLIEIIPWKVCMNNFYSQVAMHPKKRTSECSNKSIKIIQVLSIV